MSLIEQAIKKLQITQFGNRPEPQTVVAGRLVESPEADVVRVATTKSSKRIHIDSNALRALGLLPPEQYDRKLAGEYRRIKRPLLSAGLGKGMNALPNGHLIMMASALPGEGKTFTSMNLALSMAKEKDITVILVDADVAKPHISKTFGVDNEPGLVDALINSTIDIESCIIPTDIENLSILPAGRVVENATELLASSRMENIISRLGLAEPNRIVLFDSPPLLLTNESRVISNIVGQVVIILRAGYTSPAAVNEAISAIAESKPVSLILNQSEDDVVTVYYGYEEYGSAVS